MRGGGFHLDHHGPVIGRGDAQNRGILGFAIGQRRRAFHLDRRIEIIALFRHRVRVQRPQHAVDEILRDQGVAVRPFQPFAQVEGIGLAVFAYVPAFGSTGDDLAGRVKVDQPFIGVGQNPSGSGIKVDLRVERRPFRPDAPIQSVIRQCRGRCQHQSHGGPGQPAPPSLFLSDHLRSPGWLSLFFSSIKAHPAAGPLAPRHGTGPAL